MYSIAYMLMIDTGADIWRYWALSYSAVDNIKKVCSKTI